MVNNIPNEPYIDDSQTIWRYMDFASFYSLLHTKGLFFKRLDKYSDEYEGTLTEETKDALIRIRSDNAYSTPEESTEWVNQYALNQLKYKPTILSNSWILGQDENYGMWKIYLRGSAEGVAIRSTVGRLRESLAKNTEEIFLGKVNYEPLKTDYITTYNIATNKRRAYSYENEFRALLFDQSKTGIDIHGNQQIIPIHEFGATFDVDIDNLIQQIYISPFTGSWFYEVVKSAMQLHIPSYDVSRIVTSRIKDK